MSRKIAATLLPVPAAAERIRAYVTASKAGTPPAEGIRNSFLRADTKVTLAGHTG